MLKTVLASALVVLYAGALAHDIGRSHQYCAEHGHWVHAEESTHSDPVEPTGAGLSDGQGNHPRWAARGARTSDAHEACLLATVSKKMLPEPQDSVWLPRVSIPQSDLREFKPLLSERMRFRLAPKTSPPAFAS